MKYLKNHIFLIFALVSILFSIETYLIFNKIVSNYEKKIVKNYTMIVVSKTKIDKLEFKNISRIEQIDIKDSLANVKKQFRNLDIDKLKAKLPYFYKLHFKKFPTPMELKRIETKLLADPNIKKVESFRQNQNQVYNLLLMIRLVATMFMVIILFISFLLIIKQLEVWKFEHSERMYIMELFGAPFWFKSALLLKLAIIDSIVSIVFIFGLMEYIFNSDMYKNLLNQLSITIHIDIFKDLTMFFVISLVISLMATFIVILTKRDENL
jgi:cell division transport system permease protein